MTSTEHDRLQALADQRQADARSALNDLIDEVLDGLIPNDEEILALIMAKYHMPRNVAIRRMELIRLDKLRAAS